jgi:hypothetical protein
VLDFTQNHGKISPPNPAEKCDKNTPKCKPKITKTAVILPKTAAIV